MLHRTVRCALLLAALILAGPAAVGATDLASMYPKATLQNEADRLSQAVRKIWSIGLEPHLTPEERASIGEIDFRFPMPKPGDDLLNFYAYRDNSGKAVVVMPVLSLKALEDLATAYAYVQVSGLRHSTVDLYYAMLQHRPTERFPGGRPPDVLAALGIPADAVSDPRVDRLSLSLRNEAYAFMVGHEVAHVLFRHRGYSLITKAQARADEVQSDRFALELMARTATPPMGAVLYFQAQVYRFDHRGEFASDAAWEDYLMTVATHPMSVDRIRAMADHIAGPLAARRGSERAVWVGIGRQLARVADILRDGELQRCIAKVARDAPLTVLKAGPRDPDATLLATCRPG
jgi:hypothetical protein